LLNTPIIKNYQRKMWTVLRPELITLLLPMSECFLFGPALQNIQ